MKKIIFIFIMLMVTSAKAEEDTIFLKKAIEAIATQRNQAQNDTAGLQAKLSIITEELAKAQAKIKEFENKDKP